MISAIRKAYKGGWRAGMHGPTVVVVNGLKYLKFPVCPFTWKSPIKAFMWHEGLYTGTVRRLTQ